MTRHPRLPLFRTLIVGASLFLGCSLAHADEPSPARPNVLFIVADDLNDMVACYGHPLVKTPNIDRLAKKGVLFERAYCQHPICNPSRTSFLSGRRPGDKLKDVAWLPDHFAANGYDAIEVGKVAHSYGVTRTSIKWTASGKGGTERAVALLEEKRERPLFLAVGLAHTHDSVSSREYRNLYPPEKIVWPQESAEDRAGFPEAAFRKLNIKKISADERRQTISRYLASVTTLDAELGKLLDALDRKQLWKNTVVVFTSDHGKHKGEFDIWDKRSLFEVSLRVPLIVAAPGKQADVRSPRLVELVDLYPTFTELCGVPTPEGLQGTSLVPLLDDPKRAWKKAAFSYSRVVGGWSVRSESHRYSEWPEARVLTDLDNDPHELKNLASDAKQRRKLEELQALLKAGWQGALPANR